MAELARRIEEELREKITAGELQPGERLSSERELAKQYGAGRTTIRLVLTRLSAAGLLEAQQGRGYFVQQRRKPRR